MGFQGCERLEAILQQAGLPDQDYESKVEPGGLCLAYRGDIWVELAYGVEEVGEDYGGERRGRRAAQWVRLRHWLSHEVVFFVNHYGPQPVNSGGLCGGVSTAFNLLRLIHSQASRGDLIILVGNFNADSRSLTVYELERYLYRHCQGKVEGGVDSIFGNLGNSSVINAENMGSGDCRHDALSVTFRLARRRGGMDEQEGGGADAWPPPAEGGRCPKPEQGLDYQIVGSVTLQSYMQSYLSVDRHGAVSATSSRAGEWESFGAIHNQTTGYVVLRAACGLHVFAREDGSVAAGFASEGEEHHFVASRDQTGRVCLRSELGRYLAVHPGGMVTTSRECGKSAMFDMSSTSWSESIDRVPDPDACCALCRRARRCSVWSWLEDAGLEPPWPGRCVLRGGGRLERVAAPSVLSGFRSQEEQSKKTAERAALLERWEANRRWWFATTSTSTITATKTTETTRTSTTITSLTSTILTITRTSTTGSTATRTETTSATGTSSSFTTTTATTTSSTIEPVDLYPGDSVFLQGLRGSNVCSDWPQIFAGASCVRRPVLLERALDDRGDEPLRLGDSILMSMRGQKYFGVSRTGGDITSVHEKDKATPFRIRGQNETRDEPLRSGGIVYFQAWGKGGLMMDIEEDQVRTRWNMRGSMQAIRVILDEPTSKPGVKERAAPGSRVQASAAEGAAPAPASTTTSSSARVVASAGPRDAAPAAASTTTSRPVAAGAGATSSGGAPPAALAAASATTTASRSSSARAAVAAAARAAESAVEQAASGERTAPPTCANIAGTYGTGAGDAWVVTQRGCSLTAKGTRQRGEYAGAIDGREFSLSGRGGDFKGEVLPSGDLDMGLVILRLQSVAGPPAVVQHVEFNSKRLEVASS